MELRKRLTSLIGIMASAFLAVGIVGFSAAPAMADGLDQLDESEVALLSSGEPLTIEIDPETGALLSVVLTGPVMEPMSVYTSCTGGQACWRGWLSVHIWYGFDGSGATGTWPNRGNFYSGVYDAKPCWAVGLLGATQCTAVYLPPGTTASFGQELTGKAVYLY